MEQKTSQEQNRSDITLTKQNRANQPNRQTDFFIWVKKLILAHMADCENRVGAFLFKEFHISVLFALHELAEIWSIWDFSFFWELLSACWGKGFTFWLKSKSKVFKNQMGEPMIVTKDIVIFYES